MALSIRLMTVADIPLGMRLKAQNQWNQLEEDWRRQIELEPLGCFVAEKNGAAVGTACSTVFGSVAWIAMVLVDANHRGQGIGTALMEHVLANLDARKIPSIRLDATPLGRPVYEKLGFVAEHQLHRYEGTLPASSQATAGVSSVGRDDLDNIIALDQRITGTDRGRLLRRLHQERAEEMRQMVGPTGVEGFVFARPGARAWHIGPCLGSDAACRALLLDAWQRHSGQPVFLDIPDGHAQAQALARDMGLKSQRPLLRMGRGPVIKEHLQKFWTSYGPEKG